MRNTRRAVCRDTGDARLLPAAEPGTCVFELMRRSLSENGHFPGLPVAVATITPASDKVNCPSPDAGKIFYRTPNFSPQRPRPTRAGHVTAAQTPTSTWPNTCTSAKTGRLCTGCMTVLASLARPAQPDGRKIIAQRFIAGESGQETDTSPARDERAPSAWQRRSFAPPGLGVISDLGTHR